MHMYMHIAFFLAGRVKISLAPLTLPIFLSHVYLILTFSLLLGTMDRDHLPKLAEESYMKYGKAWIL